MFRKSLIILAMLAVLPSCLDDAVKPIKEAPPSTWPGMTSEDDAVRAILWCYKNPSDEDAMARYESILHSEYFFYLAPDDVDPGEGPVITRSEDIDVTALIFERQVELELSISTSGAWVDRNEIVGGPCEGCRETTRQYYIRVQFSPDGTVYASSPSTSLVTIVVAPDESDPEKWAVRAVYDIAM